MSTWVQNKLVKAFRHTPYSITLDRFGTMLQSKNNALAAKIWLPKALAEDCYNALMIEFSEMVSKNDIRKLISDKMMEVNIFNKVNSLLPSLYWCLYIDPQEKHLNFFKEYYGVECKGPQELQLILNEITRLTAKHKELFGQQQEQPVKSHEFNFSKLLVGIETVLELSLRRSLKLYELEHYYQLASDKVKKYEHGRD
jgi:hypothetical protein